MTQEDKKAFITFMVRSGVLTFGDFVTKSGRNTPYFINTGNYGTGAQAAKLGEFYAQCIHDQIGKVDVLFGPAYKGIPLATATAISLQNIYKQDVGYCFNRKEAKDHGEGGKLVGCKLKDDDRVIITEDVITAGTSVRETLPILQEQAKVKIAGLIVSVDRMEKGMHGKTAVQELYEDLGIRTYPLVTVKDVITCLHGVEIDGKVIIDDKMKERMENYRKQYCADA
ncbi:MAG TPA: orotate phosphoribosyltransferase [Ruminococcaceae bacterium]|nr:orotate phosphoribosyltransferase [Oscillospiraceae bacterium]